jgi:hypothetical protein
MHTTMKNIGKTSYATIALLILGTASISYAQNNIRIGIKGGLNASQIKTSTNLTGLLWQYNGGIAFASKVVGNLSLVGEVIYSRQGSRLALNQNDTYLFWSGLSQVENLYLSRLVASLVTW